MRNYQETRKDSVSWLIDFDYTADIYIDKIIDEGKTRK